MYICIAICSILYIFQYMFSILNTHISHKRPCLEKARGLILMLICAELCFVVARFCRPAVFWDAHCFCVFVL